jgi:hypothetical protein
MPRAPGSDHRIAIIGRTGSGKTQAGAFHLSRADFHKRPWIIFDFKGDKLLSSIHAKERPIKSAPPDKPGLYKVQPLPTEVDEVEDFLWKVWAQEKTGIYVDEGYMIDRGSKAFRALLTQGRSKECPMIILSQRPVLMDRFVFSEADFFQVFHLNNIEDRKVVEQYVPADLSVNPAKYHSIYHDIGENETTHLTPVPGVVELKRTFKKRLLPRQTYL